VYMTFLCLRLWQCTEILHIHRVIDIRSIDVTFGLPLALNRVTATSHAFVAQLDIRKHERAITW
jgi:hypothetical protein